MTRDHRRHSTVLARVVLALVAAAVLGSLLLQARPAPAQTPAATLPDLVSDAVEQPQLQTYTVDGSVRRLLRFDGFIHNRGPGRLAIEGSAPTGDGELADVVQRLDSGAVLDMPSARILYENTDGHEHFHLRAAARYSLMGPGDSLAAPASKVGFCLVDGERREGTAPRVSPVNVCEHLRPDAARVEMGLSPGWRDIYPWQVWMQWVDVSAVQPGDYRLRAQVDPDDLIREEVEDNQPSDVPVTLPGYRAEPVALPDATTPGPQTVPLSVATHGTPAAPAEVMIVDAPEHGGLNVPTGEWVDVDRVTYTSRDGGSDRFTYAAREQGNEFPVSPAPATVTLGRQRIVIWAGPASLYVGTSDQLKVEPQQVTWAVDGIVGGHAAAGTITPGGLYTAPAVPPPGGRVTITATGADGARDQRVVRIDPRPSRAPAPTLGDAAFTEPLTGAGSTAPAQRPAARPALRRAKASTSGRYVVVALLPGRTGRVRVTLVGAGGRRFGTCTARLRADRPHVCRFRRPAHAHGLRAAITFVGAGRATVTRSVRVGGAAHAAHHR